MYTIYSAPMYFVHYTQYTPMHKLRSTPYYTVSLFYQLRSIVLLFSASLYMFKKNLAHFCFQ